MTLIRFTLADLENRAATRQPGYVAAVKSAAQADPDGQHLQIEANRLNELRAQYAWPGDDLASKAGCCGG